MTEANEYRPEDFGPIHEDLGAESGAGGVVGVLATGVDSAAAEAGARLGELGDDGTLLLVLPGAPDEVALARVRNALWPALHVSAVYRSANGGTTRRTLQGKVEVGGPCAAASTVLLARRTAYAFSPAATVVKFDQNAAGWNGVPGSPGYGHFRWMRRFVGCFGPPPAAGARILDFGSGAGWCGIEAALRIENPTLHAFDPSPEMVRIVEQNAAANGITALEGRVGFGEEPPFPADGEEPYDLVISSGVVSFARDFEAWMDGLARAVRPGGTLIFGDLNPDSGGMRGRREKKALLPLREMNGKTARECRAWLGAHGFVHEETAGYQLTWPVPQAMHWSEQRAGWLCGPLLLANRAATGLDRAVGHKLAGRFDSWVMRFARPA